MYGHGSTAKAKQSKPKRGLFDVYVSGRDVRYYLGFVLHQLKYGVA